MSPEVGSLLSVAVSFSMIVVRSWYARRVQKFPGLMMESPLKYWASVVVGWREPRRSACMEN